MYTCTISLFFFNLGLWRIRSLPWCLAWYMVSILLSMWLLVVPTPFINWLHPYSTSLSWYFINHIHPCTFICPSLKYYISGGADIFWKYSLHSFGMYLEVELNLHPALYLSQLLHSYQQCTRVHFSWDSYQYLLFLSFF